MTFFEKVKANRASTRRSSSPKTANGENNSNRNTAKRVATAGESSPNSMMDLVADSFGFLQGKASTLGRNEGKSCAAGQIRRLHIRYVFDLCADPEKLSSGAGRKRQHMADAR